MSGDHGGLSEYDREIRLGLVLYGGISLAVYENGVAQEFFRAVKGEGVYGLLKEWLRADIVTDIISGTSAGGINGIMLAYALSNDLEFRGCAKLWREKGDILSLLRSPDSGSTASVLDSENYYQTNLAKAFREMGKYRPPAYSRPSDTPELDLFVTGTDVYGKVFSLSDDQRHIIDVKNHRAVFQLSYREDRKNEFGTDETTTEALAKLCRITSCFPVAFAPVDVGVDGNAQAVDARLIGWGKLAGEKMYFMDGGLLDNKPFSYTIDAIFRRTADCEVNRYMMYVEPDPEHIQKPAKEVTQPNVVQAAVRALIGIPGYESIGDDLESIARHNDKLAHYENLSRCIAAVGATCDCPSEPPRQTSEQLECIYRQARLTQLLDRVLCGVFKEKGQLIQIPREAQESATGLAQSFRELEKGLGAEILNRYDIYFRQRRLSHLVYFLYDFLYPKPPAERPNPGEYRELREALNHQFKLLEIVRFAMESLIDEATFDWKREETGAIWKKAGRYFDALLDPAGLAIGWEWDEAKALRKEFAAGLIGRKKSLLSAPPPEVPYSANLLDKLDEQLCQLIATLHPQGGNALLGQYYRFAEIDAHLFPMERLAEIESKDRILTVRVSPMDAQRGYSRKSLADKLCGESLGHFSGFFKRSWRGNDIMWGRLDGVCQLAECLMNHLEVPINTNAAFLAQVFPNGNADKLLTDLAAAGANKEEVIELLVKAAQAEIIIEEMPRVVADAIQQQRDWNEYKVKQKSEMPKSEMPIEKGSGTWQVGVKEIDRTVLDYATAQMNNQETPDFWLGLFEKNYHVGEEKFPDDLPMPILLEVVSKAGAVLENCLVASGSEKFAAKIKSKWLFKIVHYTLRGIYGFCHWLRFAPSMTRITRTAALSVATTMLAIDLMFWKELFHPFSTLRFVILFVLPISVIIGVLFLFARRRS